MSLKYSVVFLVHAVVCGGLALAAWDFVGWFAVLFLYAAVPVLLLAVAYAGAGPGLLLKQASGQQPFWAWVLFGPYFLVNSVTFGIYRWLSSEPSFVLVAPNVYFGRRLSKGECAGCPWVSVLDLAGEFAETRPLRELAGYRSLPVLNATDLSEEHLRSAVAWVTAAVATGPVYIHCVFGHNRSACVVLAYLLSSGQASTVVEAEQRLRSLRPGVRLLPRQRQGLQAFEPRPQDSPNPVLL